MNKSFEHYITSRYPDEVAHYRQEEGDIPLYVLFPDEWHIWQFQQDTIAALRDQLENERNWARTSMGSLVEKEEGIGYMNKRIRELCAENEKLEKDLEKANASIMEDLFLLKERDDKIKSLEEHVYGTAVPALDLDGELK